MPRFVLLLHECPNGRPRPTHCDLMLENGAALDTWALGVLPSDWRSLGSIATGAAFSEANRVVVDRLADHRLAYLEYEGPVSGDRGSVRRLDAGTFSAQTGALTYSLAGQFIRGQIKLQKASENDRWQLEFTAE